MTHFKMVKDPPHLVELQHRYGSMLCLFCRYKPVSSAGYKRSLRTLPCPRQLLRESEHMPEVVIRMGVKKEFKVIVKFPIHEVHDHKSRVWTISMKNIVADHCALSPPSSQLRAPNVESCPISRECNQEVAMCACYLFPREVLSVRTLQDINSCSPALIGAFTDFLGGRVIKLDRNYYRVLRC